jgi:hypothetical protein
MNRRHERLTNLQQWLRVNAVVVLGYVLATVFTKAHFSGDTTDYVESIVDFDRGRYYEFWEFGHVLWRPFGWLLMRISLPAINRFWEGDLKASTTVVLSSVSWLAGFSCVLLLAALLRRFCLRPWIINLTVLAFIVTHGFLNFAQTGPPYVTSLALMLVALFSAAQRQ